MIERDDFLYAIQLITAEVEAAGGWGFVGISILTSWLVPAFFYSLVFHRAGIGWWAAFVPILNYVKFFRLGAVTPVWVYVSTTLVVGAVFVPIIAAWISLQVGNESLLGIIVVYLYLVAGVLLATGIASLVATYRIGVGFGHGVWFFVLALFLPYVWCIVIALQGDGWDEDWYPSSIGVDKSTTVQY